VEIRVLTERDAMAAQSVRVGTAVESGDRLLRLTATVFTLAVLIHNADHLRRGADTVQPSVLWLGTAAMAIEVAPVLLVFMRHRAAPLVCAVFGFALAAGYVFVHFTPQRGWLSDSFTGGDAAAFSWFAATFESVAALALGASGWVVLRRRGGLTSAATGATGSIRDASRHPVVVAMLVGNSVILIATFVAR
jgi:hypothetical protein